MRQRDGKDYTNLVRIHTSMPEYRTALPSWLISMVLHIVLIVLLGLSIRLSPPQGGAAERTAEVGIVLKHSDEQGEYFETESPAGGSNAETAAAATTAGAAADLFADRPPADPSTALPSPLAAIGPGALEGGAVGSAIGADRGPRGAGRPLGGKARTSLFGIQGEGYKFAYVFDRSGSMGGSGRNALEAAKEQLVASLKSLENTHQFQIIFYNEKPWRFNPTGHANKLFFATEQNKTLAVKFIRSITADGGTRHEDALLMAIAAQPDVIFFLTDADEPKLWPGQLAKIKRRAAGITINAIEFGFGPQSDPNNFLVQLARQNAGRHAYVDISKMFPARP